MTVQFLDKVVRQVQFLGKVVDTPLCTTTGVMVQTVQFLDKVIDVPVCNATTRAHGVRGGLDSAATRQGR